MLYQLPDGRTIEISIRDFLDYTDEELKGLVGANYGEVLNNPSYGSAITKFSAPDPEDGLYTNKDIQDVPDDEKLKDQDYNQDYNEDN